MADPVNLAEFEPLARDVLARGVYDYYAGAADDEITVKANTQAFRDIQIRYRVLVDVSTRDTSTEVFGTRLPSPIILAPTALHRMAHPEGEAATARGAAATGTLMTLSSISSVPMEEVAAAAPDAPRWFQLYHFGDRATTEGVIRRAVDAGYGAIAVTVDAPILGRRERDVRNAFVFPEGVEPVHFTDPRTEPDGTALHGVIDQPSLNWESLGWIGEAAGDLPIVLKGIVRGDDAKRALDAGVRGLWVSNHGGRQMDTSITTARALPEVVEAADGRVPVIVDGGVRRGTDVLKALALGADLVALGRPQLWGLATGGADGVRTILELINAELSLAMALAGCPSLSDISADLLA